MSLNDNDQYLVNQDGTTNTVTQSNLMSIDDNDLLLVNQSGTTKTVKWNVLKDELGPPAPTVDIVTPTIIAPPDGAGVGGDVTYTPKTSAITGVVTVSDPWTGVSVTDKPWRTVIYADNKFVALAEGQSDSVMYSTNGIDWTAVAAAEENYWRSITYGNGKFVAVSRNGTNRVMYSDNGIDWNSESATEASQWRAVTYGELSDGTKRFVAVSHDGTDKVMYSDNGINWFNSGVTGDTAAGNFNSIAYGNGIFVAPAQSGSAYVMTSTDGKAWSTVSTGATNGSWQAITFGNGTFVAVANGGDNRVMHSTNGIDWTAVAATENINWNGVTYGNGKFVAVAASGTNRVMYSTDNGSTWSPGSAAEANDWFSVTYGDGKFVAVSKDGVNRVMWSVDGTGVNKSALTLTDANSYNADTNEDMNQPISETFTAGQTVTGVKAGSDTAVGTLLADASGNTMTVEPSTEPDFKSASATEANSWRAVTYGNGTFVAVAINGDKQVMYSADGISWNSASTVGANSWQSVTYGNGKFVAVAYNGDNRVMYSTDGINWTSAAASQANGWRTVTYGNGRFVAVASSGDNQSVMYSDDGINWTTALAAEPNSWYGVTYGNGKFVAVANGGSNRVMYSTNGIDWTASTATEANSWYSVTYGNGKFVAVSTDGTDRVMWSADGINWSSATAAENNTWRSVTYGNGNFVAVAVDGTNQVMYSPDGITWTAASGAEANSWRSVTFGNGKFVAVGYNGTNQVMYSPSFGGAFIDGMEVINSTTATKTAPSADDLEFVGSTPTSDPVGDINTWGDATWEVSTDSGFTSPMVGTKIITPNVNQTLLPAERGAIVLDGNTDYYARLSYNATNPTLPNVTSSSVHFKTADNTVNVDDVLNVTVYSGQDTEQTITTGINHLEDTLVWIKSIEGTGNDSYLLDLPRENYQQRIRSNTSSAGGGTGVNLPEVALAPANGSYLLKGGNAGFNRDQFDYVSYSFKAAPNFFDIVLYKGTGVNPTSFPHALSVTPGAIFFKRTDSPGDWMIYHKDVGDNYLILNKNNAATTGGGASWEGHLPTKTEFTLDDDARVNGANSDYIAYLFADTPGLIKCGSYVGDGLTNHSIYTDPAGTGESGYFQPQWVMIKNVTNTSKWMIFDGERGRKSIFANSTSSETDVPDWGDFRVGGFSVSTNPSSTVPDNNLNNSGDTYIYVAIAKGGSTRFFDTEAFKAITDNDVIARHGVDPYTTNLEPFGIKELTHEPVGVTAGFAEVQNSNKLEPVQSLENTVGGLQKEVEVADAKLEIVKERNKQLRHYMAKDMIAEAQALIEQWAAEDEPTEE